jgi:hypothetical protein
VSFIEDEANIVRRIFDEYVAGRTPRDIARDLNLEQVPPPRGRVWNASTINGNAQRGTGILQNEALCRALGLEQGPGARGYCGDRIVLMGSVSGGDHLVLGLADVFPRVCKWIDATTLIALR